MNCFCVTNVEIFQDFVINEYIKLKKSKDYDDGTIVCVNNQPNIFESNAFIFYRALQLAIPKVNLQVQSTVDTDDNHNIDIMKKLNSYLINYYVNDDDGGIHFHTEKTKLIEDDLKK